MGLRTIDIKEAVAGKFGLAVSDLDSIRRHNTYMIPRHALWWLVRELTPLSYPQIGRYCGGRDHTTILNGVAKHKARAAADSDLNDICTELYCELTQQELDASSIVASEITVAQLASTLRQFNKRIVIEDI